MAGKQADIRVGVITNYDDKGLNQAKTGLAGFSNSIKEADGVGGKLKAGWGSVTDSIKANTGALAVAGGGALVAFGIKAVGAFTDTAKAALDLSTATGLSTEEASRWIAVGDDFEVSAEALQTGLGKIAKTMDDAKWAQYGIQTRDAGGKARETNEILLDSFDVLSRVTNETERARIGQQLFGKGYQSITPILGHTREEYEKMLGTVEKGQVITEAEAKKAEKMRLAQDQLGDAFRDVAIQVGEAIAAMAPLLEMVAKLIAFVGAAGNDVNDYTDELAGLADQYGLTAGQQSDFLEAMYVGTKTIEDVRKELAEMFGTVREGEKSWETQTDWLDKVAEAQSETDRETRNLARSFDDVKPPIDDASYSLDRYAEAVAGVDLAYSALTGKLDEEEAWAKVNESIKEFGKGFRATDEEVRTITRDIADYVANTDTIPATKKTEILAALNEGDIKRAEMLLADLTRTRNIYLTLTGPGAVTAAGFSKDDQFAEGGIVGGPRGKPRRILAHGGELVLTEKQQEAIGFDDGRLPGDVLIDSDVERLFRRTRGTLPGEVPPGSGYVGSGLPGDPVAVAAVAAALEPLVDPMLAALLGDGAVSAVSRSSSTGSSLSAQSGFTLNLYVAGSVTTERDLIRVVADGIIDMVARGVIPAGAFAS